MNKSIALLGFFVSVSLAAMAQVEPAATGPSRPSGVFNYSLHDAESIWWSNGLGDQQSNTASANMSYINGKSRRPFSVSYAAGYTFSFSKASYGSGLFQELGLAQTITGRKWRLNISDDISYRPQAPTFGLAGIPGTGVGNTPPPTGSPTETVLTENTHTVNNGLRATFNIPISFSINFFAGGDYSILRFPDGNGLDSTVYSWNAGVSRRLAGRASISGEFSQSAFTYPGSSISFLTTSTLATLSNTWRRGLSTHVTAGPEWVSTSGGSAIPSSTRFSISGGLAYHKRHDTFSLEYYHGDNGGSGIFYGSQFDSLNGTYSRAIENSLYLTARFGYERNSGLAINSGSTSGYYAGTSVSRRLGKCWSLAASYTATAQTASNALPNNVLNAVLEGVSFSVGYSPKGMKLEH